MKKPLLFVTFVGSCEATATFSHAGKSTDRLLELVA
jgi:hypothetical protein